MLNIATLSHRWCSRIALPVRLTHHLVTSGHRLFGGFLFLFFQVSDFLLNLDNQLLNLIRLCKEFLPTPFPLSLVDGHVEGRFWIFEESLFDFDGLAVFCLRLDEPVLLAF